MNRAAGDSHPIFTPRQGQYLAFIHAYTLVNGRPPAEADMQRFFRVTPPSAHQMVVTLEQAGLISRLPGIARSIGAAAAPIVSTPLMGVPGLAALPFVIAGSLKIAYDLLLYRSFQAMRPPEERGDA